jgi:hypothetical protein
MSLLVSTVHARIESRTDRHASPTVTRIAGQSVCVYVCRHFQWDTQDILYHINICSINTKKLDKLRSLRWVWAIVPAPVSKVQHGVRNAPTPYLHVPMVCE